MNRQSLKSKHQKMTEEKIPHLTLRLALPSSIAMIVISLYSLADSLYVSKLGTDATAAVGICFAVQVAVQAVAYTFGVGAGSLLSRALGDQKRDLASIYARVALLLAISAGLFICAIGFIGGEKWIDLLGGTSPIIDTAMEYLKYLLLSAPVMCGALVFSQLLRAEGRAVYSMFGILVGGVLNILLDPLFIYQVDLGVAGASLATLISQSISFLILLSAYVFGSSEIDLFKNIRRKEIWASEKILVAGLPSAARQGLSAIATVLLNHAVSAWGDAAIAAMSIVAKLFLLVFSICLGIGQGMMPIVGYNFGYRRYGRVKHAFLYAWAASSLLMLLASIPFLFYANQTIAIFRNDPDVIEIGSVAMRAIGLVLPLHGTITCLTMLLQAVGRQGEATFLACARQGFFFLPLLFILPRIYGTIGLCYVQPVSDLFTFLLCVPFVYFCLKMLSNLKRTSK